MGRGGGNTGITASRVQAARGDGGIVKAVNEVMCHTGMLRLFLKHLFEDGRGFELVGVCLIGGEGCRIQLGDWVLDTLRYEIQRAGEPILLRSKAFQVLAYLLAPRDRNTERGRGGPSGATRQEGLEKGGLGNAGAGRTMKEQRTRSTRTPTTLHEKGIKLY
jgi:hypothetical protein